jgi:hypothetical protein
METRTTLIRYFINDIGQYLPRQTLSRAAARIPTPDTKAYSRRGNDRPKARLSSLQNGLAFYFQ